MISKELIGIEKYGLVAVYEVDDKFLPRKQTQTSLMRISNREKKTAFIKYPGSFERKCSHNLQNHLHLINTIFYINLIVIVKEKK